jgi:hypothetical protein
MVVEPQMSLYPYKGQTLPRNAFPALRFSGAFPARIRVRYLSQSVPDLAATCPWKHDLYFSGLEYQ